MRPKRDAATPPRELSTGERRGLCGTETHGSDGLATAPQRQLSSIEAAAASAHSVSAALLPQWVTRQPYAGGRRLQQLRTCAGPCLQERRDGAAPLSLSLQPTSGAQVPASGTSG